MKTIIFLFCSILFTYTANSQSFFITTDDGTHGVELWKSDGTTAGTSMVKDINTTSFGRASSNPSQLTVIGTILFFTADDRTHGTELWRSDGTSAGTFMVKDINTTSFGKGSSNPSQFKAVGNALFFEVGGSTNRVELWKSDGTAAGTSMVKRF